MNGSVPSGEALGVGDDVGSGVGVVGSGVGAGVVGCGVVGSGVGVGSGVRSVTQYPAEVDTEPEITGDVAVGATDNVPVVPDVRPLMVAVQVADAFGASVTPDWVMSGEHTGDDRLSPAVVAAPRVTSVAIAVPVFVTVNVTA